MLLNCQPGPIEHYPILGIVLIGDGIDPKGFITAPLESRQGNSHVYMMCYCGVEWLFIITDQPTDEQKRLAYHAPQEDGTMRFEVRNCSESPTVRRITTVQSRWGDQYKNPAGRKNGA
jgi:hypothetical protein